MIVYTDVGVLRKYLIFSYIADPVHIAAVGSLGVSC
jgi:hypothetical protein